MSNSNGTTINGNVIVSGDLTTRNSSFITGAGNIEVSGTTTINQTSTVFGSTTDCSPGLCNYGTGGALPIELLFFKALQITNNEIEINWETATELNNDFFTLEYSYDGEHFATIGKVQGAGNSQSLKQYRHIFEHDLNNVIYVRLIQTDYDGKFEVFKMITVSPQNDGVRKSSGLGITAFPNPSKSGNIHLSLNVSGFSEGKTSIFIYTINGSIAFEKDYNSEELNRRIDLDDEKVQSLEKGIYFIAVVNDNHKVTEKLVVI